jgi:hypothetical protein
MSNTTVELPTHIDGELRSQCAQLGAPVEVRFLPEDADLRAIFAGQEIDSGAFATVYTVPGDPGAAIRICNNRRYSLADAFAHVRAHRRLPKHVVEPRKFILVLSAEAPSDPSYKLLAVMERLTPADHHCTCHHPTHARRVILQRLELAAEVAAAGFSHGDINVGNVVVTPAGPKMVDINRRSRFQCEERVAPDQIQNNSWEFLPPEVLKDDFIADAEARIEVARAENPEAIEDFESRLVCMHAIQMYANYKEGAGSAAPATAPEAADEVSATAAQVYIHAAAAALECHRACPEQGTRRGSAQGLAGLANLAPEVAALLRRCLDPEPARRPSPSELLAAVKALE